VGDKIVRVNNAAMRNVDEMAKIITEETESIKTVTVFRTIKKTFENAGIGLDEIQPAQGWRVPAPTKVITFTDSIGNIDEFSNPCDPNFRIHIEHTRDLLNALQVNKDRRRINFFDKQIARFTEPPEEFVDQERETDITVLRMSKFKPQDFVTDICFDGNDLPGRRSNRHIDEWLTEPVTDKFVFSKQTDQPPLHEVNGNSSILEDVFQGSSIPVGTLELFVDGEIYRPALEPPSSPATTITKDFFAGTDNTIFL